MALSDLTVDAVLRAISEFDQLGRETFLEHYGFGPARQYFLQHNQRQYDSKAVAGVANKFARPDEGVLTADAFSGGEKTVAAKLGELGFVVTNGGGRNPDWTRDELILALELYMRNPRSPPGKTSKEVAELSATLRVLGERLGWVRDDRFRNTNGVYMKMMNFRRFDPDVIASGRVGLKGGNRDDESVWREFANDVPRLKAIASAIIAALRDGDDWSTDLPTFDDGFTEAPEGRVLTRVHLVRERNRKLVDRRKAAALAQSGRLLCEVCDFDFEARYGERGRGFIEVHHTKPVHTLVEGTKTTLADLALLCSNCHRMIHAERPWLNLDELRALLSR